MAGEPLRYWAKQTDSDEPDVWAISVGWKVATVDALVADVVDVTDLEELRTWGGSASPICA